MPNTAEQNISRLVLGTAQLGTKYGVANNTGQPDQHEADAILRTAWQSGVRTLDTAQAYGDSEEIIGRFLGANPDRRFNIITKLDANTNISDPDKIRAAIKGSCKLLGQSPTGLLLHNGKMLEAWNGPLGETLTELKRQGEIGEIGVSIYEPDEFQQALNIPAIKFIQAPFNVMDQRLLKSGLLQMAQEQGCRIFLRSAFLQGLLLIPPQDIPPQFDFAKKYLQLWWNLLGRYQLEALDGALKYILQVISFAEIVIGCETKAQLLEIVSQLDCEPLGPDSLAAITALPTGPAQFINPSKWPPVSIQEIQSGAAPS